MLSPDSDATVGTVIFRWYVGDSDHVQNHARAEGDEVGVRVECFQHIRDARQQRIVGGYYGANPFAGKLTPLALQRLNRKIMDVPDQGMAMDSPTFAFGWIGPELNREQIFKAPGGLRWARVSRMALAAIHSPPSNHFQEFVYADTS
jgi:hypothetical protein